MSSVVKFKRTDRRAVLPKRAHPTDAGLDLTATSYGFIKAGDQMMIDTGLSVAIPDGYAGFVAPRSGLAAKYGVSVTNSPGIIDSSYRGPLKVIVENRGKKDFEVKVGDRIAQLLIVPISLSEPLEVEELDDTERGVGGFGSTGT